MNSLHVLTTALTHQTFGLALDVVAKLRPERAQPTDIDERDRGAVSLEQVLWFVASGVSVAVIAGVLWSQIKDKADDPITPPAAP